LHVDLTALASPDIAMRTCRLYPRRAMPMPAADIEALLREAFPDADIDIVDLAGDGDHYKAVIRSAAFAGKTRVAQHQLVYAALKGRMGSELHALALETSVK
jgi:stress-induced morphogen